MTDQDLRTFLEGLEVATSALQAQGIEWGRLIECSTGCRVIPVDCTNSEHISVLRAIRAGAEEMVSHANRTKMQNWGVRRVNELGNALENQFANALNQCSAEVSCEAFRQSTGYPDRKLLLNGRVTAYIDLKTYASESETSAFRSFYHQPRQSRGKVTIAAMHLLLAIAHGPEERVDGRPFWPLEGFRAVDLSMLRVRFKGEFQASNKDMYKLEKVRLDV